MKKQAKVDAKKAQPKKAVVVKAKAKKQKAEDTVEDTKAVEPKAEKKVSVDKDKVHKEAKKVRSEVEADKDKLDDKRKEWLLGDPIEVNKLIGTLSEESMLVKIRCKAWKGTGTDKEIASELAGQMKGSVDGFSVSLKFLPPEFRKELARRLQNMTQYVAVNTLPWTNGWRLLATQLYAPLKHAVENARLHAEDYVKQMTEPGPYAEIVDYAKRTLGEAWNDERVPPADEIRKMFSMEWDVESVNVPTKLKGVDSKDMKEIQNDLADKYARKYSVGVMEIVEGLKETLEMLVEELEGSQDKTKYKMVFDMAERRIRNVAKLDVFHSKKVNMLMDNIIEEVLNPLEASYKDLKKDDKKRKELAVKCKKVLKDKMHDVGI